MKQKYLCIANMLFLFLLVKNGSSQTISDGSFEFCSASASPIVATGNLIQTLRFDGCGSPATLSGPGLAFYSNGTQGTSYTLNNCFYTSPPPADGIRNIGFGNDVVLTIPMSGSLTPGECYTISFDGLNSPGDDGSGQPCLPLANAAFAIGVSNSNTSFGTLVGSTISLSPGSVYSSLNVRFIAPVGTNGFISFQLLDQANDTSILFLDNLSFTVTPGVCALPVRLISFDANRQGDNTMLRWRTAFEKNSDRFEIEQSDNGVNFTKIGEVKAAGNTNTNSEYSYSDINILRYRGTTIYYRLKQVDIDGRFSYSSIIRINANTSAAFKASILPNPAANWINLIVEGVTTADELVFEITDISGRIMYRENIKTGGSSLSQTIQRPAVNAGIYFYKLSKRSNNEIVTGKLVLE